MSKNESSMYPDFPYNQEKQYPVGAQARSENTETAQPEAQNSDEQTFFDRYNETEERLMTFSRLDPSGHAYPRAFFRVAVIVFMLLFLTCLIWVVFTPYVFPWFIYPCYAGALFICVIYALGSKTDDGWKKKAFLIHKNFWLLTTIVLILTNLKTSGFPWSMYPCAALLFFFTVHFIALKTPAYFDIFIIHTILYIVGNLILFLTYCYTTERFPWNLVVLVAWLIVLVIHFIFHKTLWPILKRKVTEKFGKSSTTHNEEPNHRGNDDGAINHNNLVIDNAPPAFNHENTYSESNMRDVDLNQHHEEHNLDQAYTPDADDNQV